MGETTFSKLQRIIEMKRLWFFVSARNFSNLKFLLVVPGVKDGKSSSSLKNLVEEVLVTSGQLYLYDLYKYNSGIYVLP